MLSDSSILMLSKRTDEGVFIMPSIFIFNKETKLFSIMLVARRIFPLDRNTLIVQDDLCYEYRLYFDDHDQLQDFMMNLYKQNVSYVYCDYAIVDPQQQTYSDDNREIDPYKNFDIEMEFDRS